MRTGGGIWVHDLRGVFDSVLRMKFASLDKLTAPYVHET